MATEEAAAPENVPAKRRRLNQEPSGTEWDIFRQREAQGHCTTLCVHCGVFFNLKDSQDLAQFGTALSLRSTDWRSAWQFRDNGWGLLDKHHKQFYYFYRSLLHSLTKVPYVDQCTAGHRISRPVPTRWRTFTALRARIGLEFGLDILVANPIRNTCDNRWSFVPQQRARKIIAAHRRLAVAKLFTSFTAPDGGDNTAAKRWQSGRVYFTSSRAFGTHLHAPGVTAHPHAHGVTRCEHPLRILSLNLDIIETLVQYIHQDQLRWSPAILLRPL